MVLLVLRTYNQAGAFMDHNREFPTIQQAADWVASAQGARCIEQGDEVIIAKAEEESAPAAPGPLSIEQLALLFAEAARLGYADAQTGRTPRTAKQITVKLETIHVMIGHLRPLKEAYTGGRFLFKAEKGR